MWSASSENWCCCFWSVSSKQLISCLASTTLQSSCDGKPPSQTRTLLKKERFEQTCFISYLLKCFFTVQAGGGHLRQQDGHVLLLLPQPDQPLPDVGVHHAQRHLLLPTQRLVEVCEVSPDAGTCALCRPRDLRGGRELPLLSGDKHNDAQF